MKTAQDLVVDAKTRIREIGHEELLALQRGGAPVIFPDRSTFRAACSNSRSTAIPR